MLELDSSICSSISAILFFVPQLRKQFYCGGAVSSVVVVGKGKKLHNFLGVHHLF